MEIEKIIETYETQKPFYEKLSKEVKYVLEHEIENHKIKISNSLYRVKTSKDFTGKIKRKFYKNPLEEITDLAGVRIVCYYESDIHYIIEIIKRSFIVHEHIDNTKNLGVDKMGYHGFHFVISLGSRHSGARYDGIINLKCEIQVRTVLQDAWALISHHLVYKEEPSIPARVKSEG